MKNFVKHTLAIAICAAALLSSCIKEQPYELKIAQLEVAVTRADASTSKEQGDGIGNAMFWVFKCSDLDANGAPTAVLDEYAASWRVMHTVNTSTSMTAHMELPLCDADHQDYILVAILNTDAFGETIKLDQYTKFADLQKALFDASSADFWNEYPVDVEGNRAPWKMPISNWKTFTVTNDNTHPNDCYELNLPVYRAVAKAQLFVKPKTDNFSVTVTDAKIHSAGMPTEGAILTENTANGLDNNTINGAAVKSQQGNADESVKYPDVYPAFPYGTSAGTRQLYNAVTADSVNDFDDVVANTTTDTWAGSTFIYENAQVLTNTTDYKTVPAGNNGYYMEISYQVSGDTTTHTRYVALPAVVRNHDYQVKATVDAGGEMDLTVIVNEWSEEDEELTDFQNSVTVSNDDRLRWTKVPTGNVDGDVANTKDNIFGETTGLIPSGRIELGPNKGNNIATCQFGLRAPIGGKWYAELVLIEGKDGVITFENGQTVISGDISNNVVTLNICTQEANNTSNSDGDNIVELQISAKKTWGGRERTYKVYNLTGLKDGTEDRNYTIRQNIGA